ncbi:FtsW/RodA/SpoVE family cell cycle protein [Schinkia azotoformans]|uniref:FtsW/RodA/SpoVE family cell cycle protein n=1 Tax=Schinkia azotoformans TaxID=1454 RepID=UPI002DB74019|nr:FtsW/RodA/SpoVE family cell cycle protein [Schinkia azotoformans]MEC1720568.1 FtsW/RodA/SpoVE family cell cycle protein [Schinkia azotoformans]MED4414104.1 FtsW/RodA/SpoVE family cell cycle protein [Schinkia azotoformans]
MIIITKDKNYFDYFLVFLIFLLMVFSCITISSALKYVQLNDNYLVKQIIWFIIGCIVALCIFYFDFFSIRKLTPLLYIFGILLLIGVLVSPESIAPSRNGAKSWFIIPSIGSIQPSEFMKIFLILMLSYITTKHKDQYEIGIIYNDFKLLFKLGIIALIPMGLTLFQNDFGTSLVMFIITLGIIFLSGINWKIVCSIIFIGLLVLAILVGIFFYEPEILLNFISQYQLNRIYSWLDPFAHPKGIGYQLKQSILAIGSGMYYGKGFQNSNVYIPESHTDFIFALFAEEFGFIGASLLVTIYFLIIYRMVIISILNKNNTFESLICGGMITMITFHVFQNIGMVIGLIPITGIPLPLMSYGGSSILSTMLGLGIVLNISLKTKYYMFAKG